MPKTHRFQSPFEHWLAGLAVEIAAFLGFIVLIAAMTAAVVKAL